MIKKEITFLSLPDYFNKNLLLNFNQRPEVTDKLSVYFSIKDNKHLGSSIKTIYLLELIFPRKPELKKIIIKKKKSFFGQKKSQVNIFRFNLVLNSYEFVNFYRFFCSCPFSFKRKKIGDTVFINKKLKMFDYSFNLFVYPVSVKNSFFFIQNYHLN